MGDYECMFIMHIALQGCLRARAVPYGLTADTGGHIKYLLELVEAAEAAGVARQEIVVRRFHDEALGLHYARRVEPFGPRSRIVRIDGASARYLAKEEMAGEIPALIDNLVAHIGRTGRPDVIHAHYADAGTVAGEIRRRLGIPFVFTGHSLGRVKAGTIGRADAVLQRRIDAEERVIAGADRIVVSSRDEAKRQYGLYDAIRGREHAILLNPPGCDLERTDAALPPALRRRIEGPLADPRRPAVLALARPVRKKNLAGLVRAFAHGTLRERANLVVFAGTRGDLREEGGEHRAVLEELLYLQDRHDLAGHMVMPKHHAPGDVPAIYAWARRTGGVFANVALNEPFGLTFLEAAAAGLPVVATEHGGPKDIVGRLGNGLLVDPEDDAAIAAALERLLDDRALHAACARQGEERVAHYGWRRHARDYLADLARLVRPVPRPVGTIPNGFVGSAANKGAGGSAGGRLHGADGGTRSVAQPTLAPGDRP